MAPLASKTARPHAAPAAGVASIGTPSHKLVAWAVHAHEQSHRARVVAKANSKDSNSSSGTGPSSSRRTLLAGSASFLMLPYATPAAAAEAPAVAAPPVTAADLPVVPRSELGGGLPVSRVVKGCWQLSGGHRGESSSNRTNGSAAVEDFAAFAAAGITSWDAADHYGPAEALIGRYLAAHPQQRQDIQVFTKYCVFSPYEMAGLSSASVREAVERSRSRLGVEAIDLMQLYWQDYGNTKYVDAALYLADLQAQGLIRGLGATNFDVPRLEAITRAGVTLAAHQVQYSLLDRRPENGMVEFCTAHDIGLLPYGVVAGGFLSDRYVGVPAKSVEVNTYSKGKYASVLGQVGGWAWLQRLLGVLGPIAAKHGSTIANVASRWVLQRPGVPAIILGARNVSHVPDHRALFTLELDEQDLAAIQEVLDQGQQARGDCYTWERGGRW